MPFLTHSKTIGVGNKQCSHSVSSSRDCYCCRRYFKRLLLKKALITSINASLNGSFVELFLKGRVAIEECDGKVAELITTV